VAVFGWKAGPEEYPPVKLMEYAVMAEEAGFESINVSDHFAPWSEEGQACFTWTWLGAVAVRTDQMRLGPGVTCPILRYHPAIIAQAAATLSHFAPGRTYLGVGTGEALNEYAATARWPGYDQRQDMLREAIDLIRELWKGNEVSFEGEYYQTRKARLYTPPVQDIPIYISSLSPNSAKFAGKHGDGIITVGGKKPEAYRQMLKNFESGAREAGRDPTRMPRLIELNVIYGDDLQSGIQAMKKYWAGTYIPALFDQKIYTPKMSAQNGEAVGEDTIRQKGCVSSDPDDHIQFAQQYFELGFDQLYFHTAGSGQEQFLKDYGRDVLPRLKEKAPQAVS
jgi:coenzyme F420-dependent glucose-6-phosphate dehydrogenase